MIKMLIAHSSELDNPEKTVRDIVGQIDLQNGLLKNTIALLFCHAKFIEMGVTEVVCKNLPFDVVGCTSQFFALPDQAGEILLTVAVLTSDDTEFAAGVSDPLDELNTADCVHSLYANTKASLGADPDLVFAFEPTMINVTPDIVTMALDSACAGIPVFGSCALDMDTLVRRPRTIFNGTAYSDRVVLLLFRGPVKPRFFSLLFPDKRFFNEDAVITGAVENRIVSINNIPAVDFLKETGLLRMDAHGLSSAIPLVLGGGNDARAPKIVIMRGISPNGELMCSRHIQNGEILNIGAITADYVIGGAREMARKIQQEGDGGNLLFFSCILRSVVLGGNSMAEVNVIREELDNFSNSWLFLSSGGELCPQPADSGEMVNRVYQYALVACQF